MIHQYLGNYNFDRNVISALAPIYTGVYFCGNLDQNGNLYPLYVGKAAGMNGLKSRLLDHLNQDNWQDVTHFGYMICDTEDEALQLEANEISSRNPKYNEKLRNF